MRKAVVIGINDYPEAPLTSCVADAEAFGNLIRTNEDGSRNFDVKIYTKIESKNSLTKVVYELFQGENEIALLYFAGHGNKNQIDTYLVTPDAEEFDLGLSVTDLLKLANDSKSQNRIIILDCCHSGAAGSPNFLNDSQSLLYSGVTILSASKSGEEAREIVNSHGVFSNLLIRALDRGAADIRGCITPGSIYSYIDQALGAHDQRPVFKTNVSAFVSLRNVYPRVPQDTLLKINKYFPKPEHSYKLDPSYEDTNCDEIKHEVIQPKCVPENVAVFKDLQKYQSVGLVEPVDAPYMYFAAMRFKSCRLTPLGQHYWRLVDRNKI